MEEDFDYEGLPETASTLTHIMAGAAAGIVEHSALYPIDLIKTRM